MTCNCPNCESTGTAPATPAITITSTPATYYPRGLYVSPDYRSPFKCPLCDGSGAAAGQPPGGIMACHACKGTGIVWGPPA